MYIRKFCVGICLSLSMLASCHEAQHTKTAITVDSIVTRKRCEVWGFMKTDLYPSPQEAKLFTKLVYSANALAQNKESEGVSKSWQTILTSAKRDGKQIYLIKSFAETAGARILFDKHEQSKVIEALLNSLKEHAASGLVIYFGTKNRAYKDKYSQFIKKLSAQLNSEKFSLSVITSAYTSMDSQLDIDDVDDSIAHLLLDFSNSTDTTLPERKIDLTNNGNYCLQYVVSKVLNIYKINSSKIILMLPANDPQLAECFDSTLNNALGGVAVRHSGDKSDKKSNRLIASKLLYTDTIKINR